jgi:NTE family protein
MVIKMKKKTAFVLGGGGARGALQVGALQALMEAGIYPDMLVGSSIGAVNAAFYSIHCQTQNNTEKLVHAWVEASTANLLPASYLWLSVRALFNKAPTMRTHHLREFFVEQGIDPGLCYKDLKGVELYSVACDLNQGCCLLFGQNPDDSVLDGVLASTTLPPWAALVESDGRLLLDGGALSNLPVEHAIRLGAEEIIALDLTDLRNPFGEAPHFGPFLTKLIGSIHSRQAELEIALAQSLGIPVRRMLLQGPDPVTIWDFKDSVKLIEHGYELAKQQIADWQPAPRPGTWDRLKEWKPFSRKKIWQVNSC